MMRSNRRAFLITLAGPVAASGAEVCMDVRVPSGWCAYSFEHRTVYYRGEGPPIILLHEINGLSPGCIDFGVQLVDAGFKVHMPLLFGRAAQDDVVFGYFESCWGAFACKTAGKDMKVAQWLRHFVAGINPPEQGKLGVIGMCLTGGLPLNVMDKTQFGMKVGAVVMSQPALPFGGMDKQENAGVSNETMKKARDSRIPILAFRFKADTISTRARFSFLQCYFGEQFEGHELETPDHFHQTWTHRLHAVLTGPFGEEKRAARAKVISFMKAHIS